jgi:hypothetical protein
MAAILTDKFRVVFAEKFKEAIALGENATLTALLKAADPNYEATSVWLFFAKPTNWINNIPLDPIDNQENHYKIYDQIIGLKRVTSSEIRGVIRTNTWTSGTTYDIYRDDYGNIVSQVGAVTTYIQSNNFEQKLYETNFYVITSEYKVYKCLANNNGSASTVEPSSTNNAPFTLSDGYTWKYMYTINANDFEKFKTDEYVPIPALSAIDPNNVVASGDNYGGAIYNVLITTQGQGYQTGQQFDIVGDGENGKIQVETVSADGGITSIKIINPGSNYTYARINSVGGSGATFNPIITSKEGLGKFIGRELGAYRIALHARLDKNDFVFGNDFSIVGLLYNPIISQGVGNIAIGTKQLKLTAALSNSNANVYNDLSIVDSVTGASGRIVHYEADIQNDDYRIYYIQEDLVGYGLNSEGLKFDFAPDSNINIANGQETATIAAAGLSSVKDSEVKRGSGEIIYIDNRNTISRSEDQTEDFKIIVEF